MILKNLKSVEIGQKLTELDNIFDQAIEFCLNKKIFNKILFLTLLVDRQQV